MQKQYARHPIFCYTSAYKSKAFNASAQTKKPTIWQVFCIYQWASPTKFQTPSLDLLIFGGIEGILADS
jgi:hypothetical protein